jgi:hypothetical protein
VADYWNFTATTQHPTTGFFELFLAVFLCGSAVSLTCCLALFIVLMIRLRTLERKIDGSAQKNATTPTNPATVSPCCRSGPEMDLGRKGQVGHLDESAAAEATGERPDGE